MTETVPFLTVCQACDPNGLSDPYCLVTVDQLVHQTETRCENLDPVFISPGGDSPPLCFELSSSTVSEMKLVFWDEDAVGERNDYMGEATVDLTSLMEDEEAVFVLPLVDNQNVMQFLWVPNRVQGVVTLSLLLTAAETRRGATAASALDEQAGFKQLKRLELQAARMALSCLDMTVPAVKDRNALIMSRSTEATVNPVHYPYMSSLFKIARLTGNRGSFRRSMRRWSGSSSRSLPPGSGTACAGTSRQRSGAPPPSTSSAAGTSRRWPTRFAARCAARPRSSPKSASRICESFGGMPASTGTATAKPRPCCRRTGGAQCRTTGWRRCGLGVQLN